MDASMKSICKSELWFVRHGQLYALLDWLTSRENENWRNCRISDVRPITMETRCCIVFFPNYSKNKSAEDTPVPPLWEKRGEYACFLLRSNFYLLMRLHAAEPVLSRCKLSIRWSKTAHVTIDLRSRHRINPRATRFVLGKDNECRWRPRRYQVDPWSRRREVARGVLRSSPKPEKKKLPWERDREFLSSVFYTPVDRCLCIRRLAGAHHVSPAVM